MALFPTPLLLSVAFLTFFPRHTIYKETVENGDGGWTASQLIFPHTKRRRPKNYSASLPFGGSVTKKIGGKARSLFVFLVSLRLVLYLFGIFPFFVPSGS